MKKILTAAVAAAAMITASCDVERLPNGSMSAEQVTGNPEASLDALMNGVYAQLKTWSDPMHRCGEYAGDNMMIRGNSTDAFFEFISFARTPNNYRLQNFWDYGYKGIAQASNIINMFEEGKSAEVDNALGECYYVRGMLYFYFVRAYGRPYYQAPEKNLGVPIVNGTPEDVIGDLHLDDRATVAQTYEQVISDLRKAEELMYARLAVEYADKVINSGDYSLVSRDDLMKYPTIVPENNPEAIFVVKRIETEFSGFDHYYGIGGMYANIGGMGWGEMYASAKYIDLLNETGRNDWREESYYLSDARAAYIEPTYETTLAKDPVTGEQNVPYEVIRFIVWTTPDVQDYVQLRIHRDANGVPVDAYDTKTDDNGNTVIDNTYPLTAVDAAQDIYSITYTTEKGGKQTVDGFIDYYISLNRVYPQFYITKCSREGEESHLHSPVISRLSEIYLNRAEANAKLGQYGQALQDLNLVRGRAIIGGEYPTLDATNAAELIDKERTLELAYQAERSYDVFRNGGTLTRHYPGAHTQSQEIPATEYRVVYYIPQNAINAYPGTLTQNPTDNAGVILN
ncbi:RagB/SusD family nutrient uptake outer membrane protein [Muribaculaceae bacterium Isolate-004 (NCI)]|uniref:RagB/SusD family nutrient uptake outer membrane protein n=1 Tax=Paramuribaculum intestinale TaxID=2094151 RepID=UPI000FFEF1B7|nr:RagB/SusD family nutrient uptake outer membrane protein [Paramuribaculum intestinale]RXE62769.1 RagB/SusD family nutrient uptake outer membrane protein [Muribaculaceae bacterium Isolate-004 (NCI)]